MTMTVVPRGSSAWDVKLPTGDKAEIWPVPDPRASAWIRVKMNASRKITTGLGTVEAFGVVLMDFALQNNPVSPEKMVTLCAQHGKFFEYGQNADKVPRFNPDIHG